MIKENTMIYQYFRCQEFAVYLLSRFNPDRALQGWSYGRYRVFTSPDPSV